MTIFAAILHPYGFTETCLTESCKKRYTAGKYELRSNNGFYIIIRAIRDYRRSADTFEK